MMLFVLVVVPISGFMSFTVMFAIPGSLTCASYQQRKRGDWNHSSILPFLLLSSLLGSSHLESS
jgi:hypothetical protein